MLLNKLSWGADRLARNWFSRATCLPSYARLNYVSLTSFGQFWTTSDVLAFKIKPDYAFLMDLYQLEWGAGWRRVLSVTGTFHCSGWRWVAMSETSHLHKQKPWGRYVAFLVNPVVNHHMEGHLWGETLPHPLYNPFWSFRLIMSLLYWYRYVNAQRRGLLHNGYKHDMACCLTLPPVLLSPSPASSSSGWYPRQTGGWWLLLSTMAARYVNSSHLWPSAWLHSWASCSWWTCLSAHSPEL